MLVNSFPPRKYFEKMKCPLSQFLAWSPFWPSLNRSGFATMSLNQHFEQVETPQSKGRSQKEPKITNFETFWKKLMKMMKIGSPHDFLFFFKKVFQRVFALTENSVFEQKSSFWSLKKLRQLPIFVSFQKHKKYPNI